MTARLGTPIHVIPNPVLAFSAGTGVRDLLVGTAAQASACVRRRRYNLLFPMTPPSRPAPAAFEAPGLAVRWQSRGANFAESLGAAVWGPRAARRLDPSASFFRLRAAPGRLRGRGIAGSLLGHALLLSAVIPLSRLAVPKTSLPLPQIDITWYGPATNIAPPPAPKPAPPPKNPKAEPQPKPQPEIVTRAYNPNITVVFQPPHATNTRQMLVQPDSPPETPSVLPAMPNVIRWIAEPPVQPEMEVDPAELVARHRTASTEAELRAPPIKESPLPAGPLDILPNPNARIAPPVTIEPSAIRAVPARVGRAKPETAAAAPPSLASAPQPSRRGGLALGSAASLPAPPATAGAIRAERSANPQTSEIRNAAAPSLRPTGQRLVALSLSPGVAPPPPGNAYAPMSIGPHVARRGATAAPNVAGNAAPAAGPQGAGMTSAEATGPAGLLIVHNNNPPVAPPPPPEPPPRKSAPPKIAPASLAAATSPRGATGLVPANRIVHQSLAQRFLGPWRIHTLLMAAPDLTSSSGSWTLNFADPMPLMMRKETAQIVAPLPLHAVDPAYPPALEQAGIEGKVVLYAVIEASGKVTGVRVVQSLDPTLDRNAATAFSEWKFAPALLHNQPVALKVIVTVPFHYAATPH